MSDDITTHNQSGGITARNVNIGGEAHFHAPRQPGRRVWKVVVAALTAIAAIVAILTYFGITPFQSQSTGGPMSKDRSVFNITSINQQGGITAGQVNIGRQPRQLTEDGKQQLRQHLPKDKRVTVISVMGDGEAFQFATQVKDFLVGDGYNVSGVDQAVYSQPVIGQHIRARDGGSEVLIGTVQ